MQKIVTDPTFIKLRRVVNSCDTLEHFSIARKYAELVSVSRSLVFGWHLDEWIEDLFREKNEYIRGLQKGVKNGQRSIFR